MSKIRRWMGAAGVFTSALVWGCMPAKRASANQLRVRSAFDLGCPQQMITLHYVDERTRGAVGCGQRLVYLESCESVGAETLCTWQLDERPAATGGAGGTVSLPITPASLPGTPSPGRLGLVCSVLPLAQPVMPAPAPVAPTEPMDDAPDTRQDPPPDPAPPPTSSPIIDPFEDRH